MKSSCSEIAGSRNEPSRLILWLPGLLLAILLLIPVFADAAQDAEDSAVRTLSLAEARELALQSDERLLQAEEAITSAATHVQEAFGGYLPQLAFGGTWTNNLKKASFFLPPDMAAGFGGATSIEMGRDWDLQAGLSLSWNLWTAGRLSAAGHAASEGLSATEWQRDAMRDAVIYGADSAYHGVLLARENVEIARLAQEAAAEVLRTTEAAFEQGTASRFDRLRARVELTNREAPVIQAVNQLHLQTLGLLRVCGLPSGTAVELIDDLAPVDPPEALPVLLERMRENSPELKALTHLVAARRAYVDLAKASRGPVVQLQGRYALQGQWDSGLFPGENESATSATAALSISLPIFDGFAAKSGIQRSRAELRSAEIEFERVLGDRELAVRQARLNLENARLALAGRREGVELSSEAYHLALVRIENGMATALERLDAELAMTAARVQLAESLYNCNLAAAGLNLAVGGGPSNNGTEESER